MRGLTKKDQQLRLRAFNEMLKVNPEKAISHPKEDFVIENFVDRLNAIGFSHWGQPNSRELIWGWFERKRNKKQNGNRS